METSGRSSPKKWAATSLSMSYSGEGGELGRSSINGPADRYPLKPGSSLLLQREERSRKVPPSRQGGGGPLSRSSTQRRAVASVSEELRASTPGVSIASRPLQLSRTTWGGPPPSAMMGETTTSNITAASSSSITGSGGMTTAGRGGEHTTTTSFSPIRAGLSSTLDEDTLEEAPAEVSEPLAARALPFVASIVPGNLRPAEPITTGFSRLDRSILDLVNRLPDSTLEDKFELISKWLDQYHIDIVPHRVAEQLQRILDASTPVDVTRARPVKTTIAGCFALQQLMLVLKRVKPILGEVVDKVQDVVFRGIFVEPPDGKDDCSSVIIDVMMDQDELAQELGVYQRRMHLQDARDVRRQLNTVQHLVSRSEQFSTNSKRVVAKVVASMENNTKLTVLRAWRAIVTGRKEEEARLRERAERNSEVKKYVQRITSLEAELQKKQGEIQELKKGFETERENFRIVSGALQYDLNEAVGRAEQFHSQIESLIDSEAKAKDCLRSLEKDTVSREALLSSEIDQFSSEFFSPAASAVAVAALRECESSYDKGGKINDEFVLEWCRKVIELRSKCCSSTIGSADRLDEVGSVVKSWWETSVTAAVDDKTKTSSATGHTSEQHTMMGGGVPFSAMEPIHCMLTPIAMLIGTLFPSNPNVSESSTADTLQNLFLQPGSSTLDKARWISNWIHVRNFPGISKSRNTTPASDRSSNTAMRITEDSLITGEDVDQSRFILGTLFKHTVLPQLSSCGNSFSELSLLSFSFSTQPLQNLHSKLREFSSLCPLFLQLEGYNATALLNMTRTSLALDIPKPFERSTLAPGEEAYFKVVKGTLPRPADAKECDGVKEVIEHYIGVVRSSFLLYSEAEKVGGTMMQTHAFLKFVQDLRLVPQPQATQVRSITNDSALNGKDFVSALIRLAESLRSAHHPQLVPTGMPTTTTVTEVLRLILERVKCFGPFSDASLVEAVRTQSRSLELLLESVRNELFKIFRKYCPDSSPNKMGPTEFMKLCGDAGVLDGGITSKDIHKAFFAVGQVPAADMHPGINFDKFINCCCAVGLMKFSSPWLSSPARIVHFIFDCLLPGVQTKVGISAFAPLA